MDEPKNIDELINQQMQAYAWVKTDPRRANQVKEMSNAAGKAINALKLKLLYAGMRGESPEIPFLGKTSGKPITGSGTKFLKAAGAA
jgi:hypothetical protein